MRFRALHFIWIMKENKYDWNIMNMHWSDALAFWYFCKMLIKYSGHIKEDASYYNGNENK